MSNFIYENTWEENQEAMKTKKLSLLEAPSSTVPRSRLAQTGSSPTIWQEEWEKRQTKVL